jgi:acyl-CoA synthetase (AMP-forming)/AMP-acid ligase II
MAIIDFFDRRWRLNPQGSAYVQDERRFSRQEAGELSYLVAHALIANSMAGRTKGAVRAGNDVTAWICVLGLWRANMSWIPVGARNSAEDNHDVLDRFDCEVLFSRASFAPAIAELQPRLPRVRHWICIDGEAPAVAGSRSLADWVAGQPTTPPEVAFDMDDGVSFDPSIGCSNWHYGDLWLTSRRPGRQPCICRRMVRSRPA